ncbi:MAG: radical SAM protein [Candidatus Omnitrophica bacterium]|nr:radical SAM protein [Candidatus Omnitrophota bacterium]
MPELPLINICNNRCLMCTNPVHGHWAKSEKFDFDILSARIERFRRGSDEFLNNYKDAFSITGGEPTLSLDLRPVIDKVRVCFPGIKISLLTNARMFSYPDFAKKFLGSYDNLDLVIPLHAHRADIHDRITRVKNSFSQTVKGLNNIMKFRSAGQAVEIRVVIHKLNYKFLYNTIKFISANFPSADRLVVIFFEIEGHAKNNLKALKIRYTQVIPQLNKVYGLAVKLPDFRLYHFPLCVVPEKFYSRVWRTLPEHGVAFLKVCDKCPVKSLCLGIHKEYLKNVGKAEFYPVKIKSGLVQDPSNWHHPIKRITRKNA